MEEVKNRYDELLRQGLAFVLWLSLALGGLGFASVFAVALLASVGAVFAIILRRYEKGFHAHSGHDGRFSGCGGR